MLSSSDLTNCKCLGHTFFCEGRTVLQTNIVNDCLGSLYLGSAMLIKNNCKFRISNTREKFFSLGSNTWLVYSIGTIATSHVCLKAGNLSPITIKSGQSVTITLGCHIQTMDHVITADRTEDVEIVTSWLDWTMTLSQLFNHHDSKELTAISQDIRHHVNGNFDASLLLQKLDSKQNSFLADHWQFFSPVAMIGVALLIAVLSFVAWRKCCAQPSPTANLP